MEKLKEVLGSLIHMISALFVLRIISPLLKLVSKLRRRLRDNSERISQDKIARADTVIIEDPPEPTTESQYRLRISILEAQRNQDQAIISELQKKLRNAKKGEVSMSIFNMDATAANKYRGDNTPNLKEAQLEHSIWSLKCRNKDNLHKIKEMESRLETLEKAYQDLVNVVSDFIVENMTTEVIDGEDSWVNEEMSEAINTLMGELDQRLSDVRIMRIEVKDA